MKRKTTPSEILAATALARGVIVAVTAAVTLTSLALTLLSFAVVLRERFYVVASAASLVPVDPAKGLGLVVEDAPHLELESWVVNAEAVRGADACPEDLGAVFAGVDL